jgi:hypothetical protein
MNSRDLTLLHAIEDLCRDPNSTKITVMYRKHCYLVEKLLLVNSGRVVMYKIVRCIDQRQICRFIDQIGRYNETIPKIIFNTIRFDKESEDV